MPGSSELLSKAARAFQFTPTQIEFGDLKIRDDDANLIDFIENPIQQTYNADLVSRHPDMRGVRDIILKARQHGISTNVLALIFCNVASNPGRLGAVITHRKESSEVMFERVRRFYRHLPRGKQPKLERSNKRELKFQDLDSHLIVLTAGEDTLGRSMTFQDVLASELAFWQDPEAFVALMQAIPKNANLWIESTANGMDNLFHKLWTSAENGESEFHPVFLPWFLHPKYAEPVPPGFEPDQEELRLQQTYGLTNEQLAWRRRRLATFRSAGQERKFYQEFPSNPTEAFLFSGESRFPFDVVQSLRTLADQRVPQWRLPNGLVCYAKPNPGHRYVIAADTAEGVLAKGADRDFHAALVWDCDEPRPEERLVAVFQSRDIEPFEFAECLYDWGKKYNTALLAIELNNDGKSVIQKLYEMGYPRIYTDNRWDAAERKMVRDKGVRVTPSLKPQMVNRLAEALTMGDCLPVDVDVIRQLANYGRDPKGRLQAMTGHDDLVSALLILWHVLTFSREDEEYVDYATTVRRRPAYV